MLSTLELCNYLQNLYSEFHIFLTFISNKFYLFVFGSYLGLRIIVDVDSVTYYISSPTSLMLLDFPQANINGLVNTYWVTVSINYKHIL